MKARGGITRRQQVELMRAAAKLYKAAGDVERSQFWAGRAQLLEWRARWRATVRKAEAS